MTDRTRELLHTCREHGMRVQLVAGRPDLARIFCRVCGWPEPPNETVIEQYLREPYGCPWCGPESTKPA